MVCPVRKVTERDTARCVKGIRAWAAHASAAVTPGHHLEGNAGVGQRLGFLAAAAENVGIAAFQPHHALPGARQPDQQSVDLGLGLTMVGGPLADIDSFDVWACHGEHLGANQAVVHDYLGLTEQPVGAERQKVCGTGAGADQINFATVGHAL